MLKLNQLKIKLLCLMLEKEISNRGHLNRIIVVEHSAGWLQVKDAESGILINLYLIYTLDTLEVCFEKYFVSYEVTNLWFFNSFKFKTNR